MHDRVEQYLDAMSFIENETMIVDGMDDASANFQHTSFQFKCIGWNLLSSFTIPSVRVHPFNSFRWIDSSPESSSCQQITQLISTPL